MIFYINQNLFKVVKKPGIESFHKTQVRTALSNTRVCSFLFDGANMDSHKHNIKVDQSTSKPNVLIRSSSRNNFDAVVILAAIPFNGVLLESTQENYRYRHAFVEAITDDMKVTEPSLVGYSHILYAIIEPNVNTLVQEKHSHHCEAIVINTVSKAASIKGVNVVVTLTNDAEKKLAMTTEKKLWDVTDPRHTNPLYVPYQIYSEKDKNKSKDKKPFVKKPFVKPAQNGYSKPFKKDEPTTLNRPRFTGSSTGYQGKPSVPYRDSFDQTESKYPAKSKKEIQNKTGERKTFSSNNKSYSGRNTYSK